MHPWELKLYTMWNYKNTELLIEMPLTILTTYGKEPFLFGVSATSDAVTEEKEKIEIKPNTTQTFFILKQLRYLWLKEWQLYSHCSQKYCSVGHNSWQKT